MSCSYSVMGKAQMETEHPSAAYLLPGPTTGTERNLKVRTYVLRQRQLNGAQKKYNTVIITEAFEYSKQVIYNACHSPANTQPAPEQRALTSFPLVYMRNMTPYVMEYHFGVSYSGLVSLCNYFCLSSLLPGRA